MKIRAIRVHNVGRFAEPFAIEGLTGGLDVMAEGNEFGKSTLFRAIEAVFQIKHTVKGQAVEAMRPYGGGDPLIEADFSSADGVYRIRKQFGRRASAELSDLTSGRTMARGQEAEDELAGLVGMADGKPSRFGLLWVGQRKSLDPADPDTDAATGKFKDRGERGELQAAIEREIETVTSGAEVRVVRNRVAALLSPYTGGRQGQPKSGSELERALKERDRLKAGLDAARKAEADLSERVDRLERLLSERTERYSDAALGDLERAAGESRLAYDAARDARARLDRAEAVKAKAMAAASTAGSLLAEFDRKLSRLDQLDAEIQRAEPQGAELGRQAAAARRHLAEAENVVSSLESGEHAARAILAAHAQFERRQDVAIRLERLSRDLAASRTLEREIAEADATLQSTRLTADLAKVIEVADSQVTRLVDKLAAAAPAVEIELLPTALGRVSVDGQTVLGSGTFQAPRPLRIEIDGIGTILVAPGAGTDRRDAEQRLATERRALASALSAAGVGSASEAVEKRRDCLTREQALKLARQSLSNLAPGGVAVLVEEVAALQDQHVGLPAGTLLSDPADVEARLARLATDRRAAGDSLDQARKTDQQAGEAERAYRAACDRRLSGRQELDALLPPVGVRQSERARLQKALADAESAANDAVREAAAFSEQAPTEPLLDALRRESEAASALLRTAERRAKELAAEIGGLEGELKAAGEDGSGTSVAALVGELALADATVARFEAIKRGLALLDTALSNAERETQNRFLRPVIHRLQPYLTELFPGGEVRFSEGFKAATLVRNGVSEAIGGLSDGTREQLAVMVRLAFGRLLSDAGTPTPVILDDALVYADDDRIARMFNVLEQAARHHQVLVLTCRSEVFSRLGGSRLKAQPWVPHMH